MISELALERLQEIRMKRSFLAALAVLTLVPMIDCARATTPNLPSYWEPKETELVSVPRYCWAQLSPAGRKSGLPTAMDLCGTGMNHLCPGLIGINRAANPTYDRAYRRGILKQARIEIDYTKARMQSTCPLLPDLQAAEIRIRTLEQLLR
jgi:hypothetical protein